MLVDEAIISASGGHGGPGKASFFRKGVGPDGGNGGKGGSVYLKSSSDLNILSRFAGQKDFSAEAGQPGGSNKKFGVNGRDLTLQVPVGTDVVDLDNGETFSLNTPDQIVMVAAGGKGGQGNNALKSPRMTTPLHAQHGLPGQKRRLKLSLKLIADYGLIGLPNSGKSSLLNALTSANAKVGDYEFTTLEPNLGVFNRKVIADIPGLIAGASQGKGLGLMFLKHVEKVPVLLHCLAADSENPVEDYKTVRLELQKYNPSLLDKKEILLITKADLVDDKQLKKVLKSLIKLSPETIPVSILDDKSLEKLKLTIAS